MTNTKKIYKIFLRVNIGEDNERNTFIYASLNPKDIECFDALNPKLQENDEFLRTFGETNIKDIVRPRKIGGTVWDF